MKPYIPFAPPQARRRFLKNGLAGLAAIMAKPALVACSSEDSEKAPPKMPEPPKLVSNLSAVGPLQTADADGVRLPEGFSVRKLATTGEKPLADKEYLWHQFPDGGATYATEDGGWIYVSNSEFPFTGGVGALRFDRDAALIDAYPILQNTNVNCAGGKTPWGTWLSCEEVGLGKVYECDPTGKNEAKVYLALGVFKHEAVAVDPATNMLYLTEDESDGRLYRFTPKSPNVGGRADLNAGVLEVLEQKPDGSVIWHPVPEPQYTGKLPTRKQVAESTAFDGGEGLFYFDGVVYFSTKGDDRVWALHLETQTLDVLYDAATIADPILTGVDNLTGTCCGDILVAEDGGDMQIVAIMTDGSLKPLVQIEGQDKSEITGPAFDPSGTRLYFSSQRGTSSAGFTYEVTGPFHLPA